MHKKYHCKGICIKIQIKQFNFSFEKTFLIALLYYIITIMCVYTVYIQFVLKQGNAHKLDHKPLILIVVNK